MTIVAHARALAVRGLGASSPLVAGRLASAVLTFALPLVLARMLTPALFGTYKQFFLIAVTLQLTGQLGLGQSLYYFVPRGGPERGSYMVQTALSMVGLGAMFGSALWCATPLVSRWLSDGALLELRWPLALFSGLQLVAAPLEGALTSEGRIGGAATAYVVSDAVRAAALVVGAKWGGPTGLFWMAAATSLLRVITFALLFVTRVLPFARPTRARLVAQLAYALPFAGAIYLYVAQRFFAQYAVSANFDAANFATFSIASFFMPAVDIVYTPLGEVMMVQMGRALHDGRSDGVLAAWQDAVGKLAAILLPCAVCGWLFGPTILPVLFTHKYDASVPLLLLAIVEIPLWIWPLDGLLRAAGDTRFLFALNAARIVATGILVVSGIKLGGLRGAIAGGIVSEALARVGMVWRGRHFLRVSWTRALNVAAFSGSVLAALIACIPAWLAQRLPLARWSSLLLAILLYGATYLSLTIWWTRRAAQLQPAPAIYP
jgi:O-antigen/teichoic acid export membrane protein